MTHARVVQGDIAPLPFDDASSIGSLRATSSTTWRPIDALFVAEARRVGPEIVVVEDVRSPDAPQGGVA